MEKNKKRGPHSFYERPEVIAFCLDSCPYGDAESCPCNLKETMRRAARGESHQIPYRERYETGRKLLAEGVELREISRALGHKDITITQNMFARLRREGRLNDEEWEEYRKQLQDKGGPEHNSRAVEQLDRNGDRVNLYPSIAKAGRALGIKPSNICGVLRGRGLTAGGYGWRYLE